MKKKARDKNNEMLRNYGFSQGVRGKYAQRYARGSNVVVLDPDVAKVFPNADAVNSSPRSLARLFVEENRQRQDRRSQAARLTPQQTKFARTCIRFCRGYSVTSRQRLQPVRSRHGRLYPPSLELWRGKQLAHLIHRKRLMIED